MITSTGKTFIKRYLAGQAGTLVGAMSVGIGNLAPAVGDTKLRFEFARIPVNVTDFDMVNNQLIFKGTLPETVYGTIYEVGLWTSETNPALGSQENKILTSFDSATEVWTAGTFVSTNTRLGADSLRIQPAVSSSLSAVQTGLTLDLVDYSSLDQFVLAFYNANANTSSLRFRLRTDASNYYEYSVSTPATGFNIATFDKGSATVVGTPDWSDINEVLVSVTAGSGGAADVQFDGLRIEDIDSVSPQYGLISRYVLSSPINKAEGIIQDVEYALNVSI